MGGDNSRMNEWFSPQEQLARACPSNVQFSSPASLPAGLFANCEQEFQIARFPQRGQNSFVFPPFNATSARLTTFTSRQKKWVVGKFPFGIHLFFFDMAFVIIHPGCVLLLLKPKNSNHPWCWRCCMTSSHAQWSRMWQLRTICLYTGSAFAWGANSWGWWYIMNHDSLCSWEGFLCSWKSRSWWSL